MSIPCVPFLCSLTSSPSFVVVHLFITVCTHSYGLKLLSHIVECNPAFVPTVHGLGLVPLFFEFFELDHRNNNIHNVRLIRMLVESPDIDFREVYQLGEA